MFKKTIKISMLLFFLCQIPTIAQTQEEIEKQQQEFEQKALEQLNIRIKTFLADQPIDDFQKEIIKQKLISYYQAKKVIYMNRTLKYYERDEQVLRLDNSHFLDIENMITENTMDQIELFIKDAGATLEKESKKKKKKKKKKEK